MPTALADPVLSLAVNNIHKIDAINAECLSSMWTVFTKCKENLENGRRLENLSWRLWFRESLSFDLPPVLPTDILHRNILLPDLSSSVDSEDSVADIRSVDNPPATRPPAPTRTLSSRSRHLTPDRFQRLISALAPHSSGPERWKEFRLDHPAVFSAPVEKTTTVAKPCALSPAVDLHPSSSCPHEASQPVQRASTAGATRPHGSVIHGFQIIPSAPTDIPALSQTAAFYLGASSSPPNNSATPKACPPLSRVSTFADLIGPPQPPVALDTTAEETDDEWDSIYTSSGNSSPTETQMFPKVEGRPPLASNRSLLSCLLESKTCTAKSSAALSRLATPDPSPRKVTAILKTAPLRSLFRKSSASALSAASANAALQISASPRTTRRNMLATELSESLRRNLLWERQQKTMTSAAVLKRRYTSTDISNLSEFPNPNSLSPVSTGFDQADHHEYHAVGW
ncbi:hypothetical protein NEOLI_003810 [Neolecta irregularis DAH-3]|uniref:Uncharacterized protein n=1 Tax=Neolecta irregularis (strain DAH-3) TaxID=1198029 RepID=A0A1U7LNJ5_NEOID|nr:hypothetical protein NEOLI_003810 [Neolecta irregularis DAH-3]|eukprot:OLL24236.1 hypothetical protein NEOLI_003810 [Neolecta irregularis DAH-3]